MKKSFLLSFFLLSSSLLFSSCDGRVPDNIIQGGEDLGSINNKYYQWGVETLNAIDRDLKINGTDSYYENQKKDQVSFIWGNIFLLYAYDEMIQLDRNLGQRKIKSCFDNLERHWHPDYKGVAGYSTSPIQAGYNPDRYYDENGWMSIGLSDAFNTTEEDVYHKKAIEALNFSMHGEDQVLGGGIYFQETFSFFKPQKNTICSGVAMLANMKLYQATKQQSYLDNALRLDQWTSSRLLDPADNLFWDAIMVSDQSINEQKWSYNAGFMVRSWLMMYKATGEIKYLDQAKLTLRAAEARWANLMDGSFSDPGYFAFTIVDCWFDLYDLEKDRVWLDKAFKTVDYIRYKLNDGNNRYPEYWNKPSMSSLTEYDLRFSSVVAYIYFRAANYEKYRS